MTAANDGGQFPSRPQRPASPQSSVGRRLSRSAVVGGRISARLRAGPLPNLAGMIVAPTAYTARVALPRWVRDASLRSLV